MSDGEQPILKVCETCPWLKKNHGRRHPGKWYTVANLKRLWNGLRKGEASGVVCHASDPDQAEYGGTANIKPGTEPRPCAGAILALAKHVAELNANPDYRSYKRRHKLPLTKLGVAAIFYRQISGAAPPPVEDRSDEVGLPWDPKPETEGKTE